MHPDQADTLRRLMQERQTQDPRTPRGESAISAPVFTFASGKGGVGKSVLVANLGVFLARQGLRVLLVDGDVGLANLDILLGLPAERRASLEQVLEGRARIQDAIVGVEPNLWLIPAASGLNELRKSDAGTRQRLLDLLTECPWEMDAILLDSGAGIGPTVLSLQSPVFETVVVLTPEPTSLSDAYSLVKMSRWHAGVTRASVIVNQVTDAQQARGVYQKLKDVAARFIDTELEYLGHCQKDEKITQSVMKRKILLDLERGAPSIACFELLAKRISAKCQATLTARATGASSARGMLRSDPLDYPVLAAAQGSSGNTARFWRTLLGEVKT